MKAKYISLITIFSLFLMWSCTDKDEENGGDPTPPAVGKSENEKINKWIYDEMSFQYFWNTSIPDESKLNFKAQPDAFFNSLIYNYNTLTGDRFSYMEKDGVNYYPSTTKAYSAGTTEKYNDIGFDFQAYRFVNDEVKIFVNYVKEGSSASKQKDGIKRGDIIGKIDGNALNVDNWLALIYSGKSSLKLEFENRSALTLEATPVLAENPIFMDTILILNNKKIGYIVYNFFANDKGDDSYEYAVAINKIFENYTNNIDELILDLRYNGGGYVESGNYIASAIVPKRNTPGVTVYTQREYNERFDTYLREEYKSSYHQYVNEYFSDKIGRNRNIKGSVAKLEMPRLYVITSERTASASEQIINGLGGGQYVDVQIIGEQTTGKNMESFAIEDEDNEDNSWVLHPLSSRSFHSKAKTSAENLYYNGFDPTYGGITNEYFTKIGDFMYLDEVIYPLGDRREKLLSLALNCIAGKPAPKVRATKSGQQGVEIKRLQSSGDFQLKGMIIDLKK